LSAPPRLAVVVPHYGDVWPLDECLSALDESLRLVRGVEPVVVVVWDEPSGWLGKRYSVDVVWVVGPGRGYVHAYNIGLRAAMSLGPLAAVCMVHSDVTVPGGWAAEMLRCLRDADWCSSLLLERDHITVASVGSTCSKRSTEQ